jgi:hypothetical protein
MFVFPVCWSGNMQTRTCTGSLPRLGLAAIARLQSELGTRSKYYRGGGVALYASGLKTLASLPFSSAPIKTCTASMNPAGDSLCMQSL